MTNKESIPFTKMQGIGNDFVMVDLLKNPIDPALLPDLAQKVCHRRFGIGADGLILADQGQNVPFQMRMFNPDGSEGEMCGNGIRCLALFLQDEGHTQENVIPVETKAGLLTLNVLPDRQVQVDMGPARLTRSEIGMTGPAQETFVDQPVPGSPFSGTAISMGNPHLVLFVPDLHQIDPYTHGKPLENHPLFPNRTNVHFVQILNDAHIQIKIWEKGAGATLACGTGACACAVAACLNGHTGRNVKVTLPGGDLQIQYQENGRVLMTGPAQTSYQGHWPL